MTKITFSPLVNSISGKTGNMIFSSWKGQPYVKNLVTPANPQTVAQQANRALYARCVGTWRRVGIDVRDFWKPYSKQSGNSGFNDWITFNRVTTTFWLLNYLTPPNILVDPALTFSAVKGGATDELDLVWTGGPWPASCYIYVWIHSYTIPTFYPYSIDIIPANDLSATIYYPWSAGRAYCHLAIHDTDIDLASEAIKYYTPV